MSEDEFDGVADEELEDIDAEIDGEIEDDLDADIDAEIEDELDADIDLELDEDLGADLVDDDADSIATPTPASTAPTDEDDEEGDVLDLDEELHPDDVEAPLDALLQERTAKATLEDEEEEVEDEEGDADERGEGPTRIVPRRPGEFLCSSCFLVLPRHQLADEARNLCRDCA
ncbi:MAG: DUF4193 family protein [Actinomycetota bacterium]